MNRDVGVQALAFESVVFLRSLKSRMGCDVYAFLRLRYISG